MPSLILYICALVLGAAHALLFSPVSSGGLQIVALAALLALLRSAAKPARVMLVFGVAWFVVGMYWMHFSMHDIGGLPTWVSAAAVLLVSVCLSVFYAGAVHLWAKWRVGARSELLALCVGFPVAWLAAELARGYLVFGGFSWLVTGYAQADNVLLKGWFSVLGVYGVGFWVAFLAGVLLSVVLVLLNQIPEYARQKKFTCVAVLVGLGAVFSVVGWVLQGISWGSNAGAPVAVRMIQTNVPQNLKFDRNEIVKNTHHFLEQAQLSAAPLTIFPETVLPYPWQEVPEHLLAPLKESLIDQRAVLIGSVGSDERGFYNSAMWLDGQSDVLNPQRYDKSHLLPFGESIPFGFQWLIDAMNIPLGGFQSGQNKTPFVLNTPSSQVRVAVNICFENVFGEELINAWRNGDDAAPQVWVNMTNLAWFGSAKVSTNQAQFLQVSRVRAMEMARPMLVVSNTGPSAHIDAMGVVVDALPADQAVSVDVRVQPRDGMTPYVALGNTPLLAFLSLVVGVMLFRRHRHTGF